MGRGGDYPRNLSLACNDKSVTVICVVDNDVTVLTQHISFNLIFFRIVCVCVCVCVCGGGGGGAEKNISVSYVHKYKL